MTVVRVTGDNSSPIRLRLASSPAAMRMRLGGVDAVRLRFQSGIPGAQGAPGENGAPGAAGENSTFETRTAAAASSIPADITYLWTSGYTTPGDGGGAHYKKVGADPGHGGKFQSFDGAWWEYVIEGPIDIRQMGAAGAVAATDHAAFVAAIACLPTAGGTIYVPPGEWLWNGPITCDKQLVLRGDGPHVSRIRQTVAGGMTFTASAAVEYGMEMLVVEGIAFVAGVASCGSALYYNFTGGSGYAGIGPRVINTHFIPSAPGNFWTRGIEGWNVRNAMFREVHGISGHISDEMGYLIDMNGDSDPVELWVESCYAAVLHTFLRVRGEYEGIYVRGCNTVTTMNGVVYAPTAAEPVAIISGCYFNGRVDQVYLGNVVYFQVIGNGMSGTTFGTGTWRGVRVERTGGAVTQSLITNNVIEGVDAGHTEEGVRIENGNLITIDYNAFSLMDTGVALTAGGTGACRVGGNNTYFSVGTQISALPARRLTASRPEVAFRAHCNNVAQTITPLNSDVVVTFTTENYDYDAYYDTSNGRWTPPGGNYIITASVLLTTNVVAGDITYIRLLKNGSLEQIATGTTSVAGMMPIRGTFAVVADGDDYFQIAIYVESASGTQRTLTGNAVHTWFEGRSFH